MQKELLFYAFILIIISCSLTFGQDDPCAHWKLDETSGLVAADELGTSDGTLVNMNGDEWFTGLTGNCIDFLYAEDTTAHILVPDNDVIEFDSTHGFTISVLVSIDPWSQDQEMHFVIKGITQSTDSTGKWYSLAVKQQELRFAYDDDINKTQLAVALDGLEPAFPVYDWAHFVGVRDLGEDQAIIYLNGAQVGATEDLTDGDISSDDWPLYIGNGSILTTPTKGMIDDVRLYNYALTGAEIEDLYTSYYEIGIFNRNDDQKPLDYYISQNYPNPFNPSTTIYFNLIKPGFTTLKVYNTAGQLLTTLLEKSLDSGSHQVTFNAINYATGVYFYKIESGTFMQVKKMIYLK